MRSSFRAWLASIIPRHYHPSIYAIASGVALTTVVFFWMPTQMVVYQLEGLFRFLARSVSLFAIAGFWWGVRSLEDFDTFGLAPLKTHLSGRATPGAKFYSPRPLSLGSVILSIFSCWFSSGPPPT